MGRDLVSALDFLFRLFEAEDFRDFFFVLRPVLPSRRSRVVSRAAVVGDDFTENRPIDRSPTVVNRRAITLQPATFNPGTCTAVEKVLKIQVV